MILAKIAAEKSNLSMKRFWNNLNDGRIWDNKNKKLHRKNVSNSSILKFLIQLKKFDFATTKYAFLSINYKKDIYNKSKV